MPQPDWSSFVLDSGILREADAARLVAWVPIEGGGGWDRIANANNSPVESAGGVSWTAASMVRVRPTKPPGLFGRLFGRKSDRTTWTLPDGSTAESTGERASDLVLAWADDSETIATVIRIRWPAARRTQTLARNLAVVIGAESQSTAAATIPIPTGTPREQAERLLYLARSAGDRRREIAALTDFGVVYTRDGDRPKAVVTLEEALALARELDDQGIVIDVLTNLTLAIPLDDRTGRALALANETLAAARASGDKYREKLALEHLGVVSADAGDHAKALAAYEQALPLAREVDDRAQQADLLWYQAVEHAELGRRDLAINRAESALELFKAMGHPQVSHLAGHLQQFKRGDGPRLASGGLEAPPGTTSSATTGPGVLRMALDVAKSMGKFLGSGLKVVPQSTLDNRLRTCNTCEQHTGVRCKLCGCFTSIKAKMPHERCPVGKWVALPLTKA